MVELPQSRSYQAAMHTLAILFGVGAWVAINGVWVELPVLISNPVKSLPEGWALPSYLVVISQVANIGPLIVTLLQKFRPDVYHQNVMIYTILVMGTAACFTLIFLWDVTGYIAGTEYSIALFTLFFILAFTDCTSSVTFLPFMSRFQKVFLTTYFIGEGLSGFLPSIVALGQGASMSHCVNETKVNVTTNETYYEIVTHYGGIRFSVDWFFGFLFAMMLCSMVAFLLLNQLSIAKAFRVRDSEELSDASSTQMSSFSAKDYRHGERVTDGEDNDTSNIELCPKKKFQKRYTTRQFVYIYTTVFWITCISNGIMPSVISYSSLPYGQLPYHFAATLGAMANPVACFISLFLPVRSHTILGILVLIASGFACFLMVLAVQSPCPVLVNSVGGSVLMVLSHIIFVGATSYAKVTIGQMLRARGRDNSLVWYGSVTQFGSMCGAFIMFPLVNVYYFFHNGDPCTTVCP